MEWDGRRVLVTGASGFVGSHLTEGLLARGAEVRAFLHYNARGDIGNLACLPEGLRSQLDLFFGDMQQLETAREALDGIETVFNLAALVGIPYSYRRPQEVVSTNLVGTMNMLLACRDAGTSRLVHTSTSEVYGTARYAPIDEAHPKQPQSPYSASKIAADALALSFHYSYDLPVAIIRPFNTYGPRQSRRAVIPAIIAQALTQTEIRLGNLAPTRDFTYVLDLVDAFIAVAGCDGAVGREINIGTGREISIGDLAQKITGIVGREDLKLVTDPERVRPAPSEVQRLIADASTARELLGWSPSTSIDEGLAHVVEWMRGGVDADRSGDYAV